MKNYDPDSDLEKDLQSALFTPAPSDAFVERLRSKLHSKENEMETKTQNIRSKRLWIAIPTMLIMLVITLTIMDSPQMVAALQRWLGYVPGVGLVENDSSLRVLAEPVSQTRGGITISVNEAVISSDKTVIVYTVENIPLEKLSPPNDSFCTDGMGEVRLPDGTLLQSGAGGGSGSGTSYEWRFSYAPVPAKVNDITLVISCIQDAAPGVLPENWELALRFVPAPPDMTALPVIEISPSTTTESGADAMAQYPLSITKVIDAGDSYILIGEFQPPAPSQVGEWESIGGIAKLSDAKHQEVIYEIPQDIDLPWPDSATGEAWVVKFSKGFTPPIQVTYSNRYTLTDSSQETVEFEFDAGQTPQEGQEWVLNKEIQMADYTFTLVSIRAAGKGYEFEFISLDKTVMMVNVSIDGYTPNGGGGGGGGPDGGFSNGLNFTELPKGKLKVVLSNLEVYGETKNWTLEWQP